MKQTKQKSILISSFGLETLEQFVRLLNTTDYWGASLIDGKQKIGGDYRPIQAEMRRLVRSWVKSGPNVSKLLDADPMVDKAIRDFQTYFVPTKGGTAQLASLTLPEYSLTDKPLEIALGHFIQFLLNPYNEKLAGPCKRCDNYFVKKTDRKNAVYCSRNCGHLVTSCSSNEARRNLEHEAQLKLAEQGIAKWLASKTDQPWKEWIARRSRITKHWLTRAVRNKEIVEPIKST